MATQSEYKTKIAEGLVDAFNRGDWEPFRTALTPDSVYEEPATGRRVEGVEEYLELLRTWKQALPDATGTIRRAVASGDTVALELLWEGTQTGDLQTPGGALPASGRKIEIEASMWLAFEGDKVRETRHLQDIMTMLQQLGAIPAPS